MSSDSSRRGILDTHLLEEQLQQLHGSGDSREEGVQSTTDGTSRG